MRRRIIVTDLTRFKNPGIVCLAGIDPENGECIRPTPYLETETVRRLNILPGAVLSANFTTAPGRQAPHQEDYWCSRLSHEGMCISSEFKRALEFGLFDSLEAGFGIALPEKQKFIPHEHAVQRSIITISVSPRLVEMVEDSYNPDKVKLNFTDRSGRRFRYFTITDLGFCNYAVNYHEHGQWSALTKWVRLQDEVLIRVGLSRRYQSPDGSDGYWLQVNGIYTFPECHKGIRSHS